MVKELKIYDKPITLIGIIFSREARNIVEWLEEELA